MEKKGLALFLADFDHQVSQIDKIYEVLSARANSLSTDTVSPQNVESTGYWLHNLFSAYEDLFKIVAAFWENNISQSETFHKSLIKRMLLNIEGIRPALLSEASFHHLDELRGFRHVFRHAYSYGLDDERVIYLLNKVLKNKTLVLDEIKSFKEKVAALADKNNT